MLKRLQELFVSFEQPDESTQEYRQHLAIAILLLEVARSDHDVQELELARLLHVLECQWALSGEEAKALLEEATREVNVQVSLHEHLKVINAQLKPAEKTVLVRNLWEIAYVNGEIHHWEEHLIRRLAELLGVAHKDFILGKNHVLDSASNTV